MAYLAKERTNALYTVTLKNDAGVAITKASVTSFKVTLFCLDDDAQTIINSRNAQEQATAFSGDITMDATSGVVTYAMTPADNQLILLAPGALQRYERHRLIFDVTAGGKRLVFQEEILVENTEKVTT